MNRQLTQSKKIFITLGGLFFVIIFVYSFQKIILLKKTSANSQENRTLEYNDNMIEKNKLYQSESVLGKKITNKRPAATTTTTAISSKIFADNFNLIYSLEETGSIIDSANPNWWISSGGYFNSGSGTGKTILGDLSASDYWHILFNKTNPIDTDRGLHPQNIFRLVQRGKWQNLNQQLYFKINKDNLSSSVNRNASNGLLLFNRYQDAFNLYYTGIRVDGYAVIKKKTNGKYFTMAYQKIFPGTYDRNSNPNLLPKNIWIGVRSVVKTLPDNTVSINVYTDFGKTGNWTLAAQAIDDGIKFGGATINAAGYGGVRTDFMDVEFSDYSISKL